MDVSADGVMADSSAARRASIDQPASSAPAWTASFQPPVGRAVRSAGDTDQKSTSM